jgi:hypothetical protein
MILSSFRPSRTAVAGALAIGAAIALSSSGIVRAERVKPAGSVTYSCSSGPACIEGSSTGSSTWAVYGTSTGADGVHGAISSTTGSSGVAGISTGTSGSGHGVYGRSTNGAGVYASASTQVNGSAVYGTYNGQGSGVTAVSDDTTGTYQALLAYAEKANTNIFTGFNSAHNRSCTINSTADLLCEGSVSGSVLHVRHRSGSGHHVLTFSSESTSQIVEDFGSARLDAGIANVQINPDFAPLMARGTDYFVFLTPQGDSRGLFISMKTPNGFQVRENERGRTTMAFDYRIVARPSDAQEGRLPPAPRLKRPASPTSAQ